MENLKIMKDPLIYSILSFVGLILFYFLTMGLISRSWAVTLAQFKALFLWMVAISLSFSAQVYLFLSLRKRVGGGLGGHLVTTTATTSTFSMVACCAHHLTDVLPLIGLSLAATFLARYQEWFLAAGIVSNLFGVGLMVRNLKILKKI